MKTTFFFILFLSLTTQAHAFFLGIPYQKKAKTKSVFNLIKILENRDYNGTFSKGHYNLKGIEVFFCSNKKAKIRFLAYENKNLKRNYISKTLVKSLMITKSCGVYDIKIEKDISQLKWKLQFLTKGFIENIHFELEKVDNHATSDIGNNNSNDPDYSNPSYEEENDDHSRNSCNVDSTCGDFPSRGGNQGGLDPITGGGYFGV